MSLRFRKSIKIAPGLKVNLNKKSVSVTGGVKGAHYTVSSTGKRTASAGIPGTGLSYVETSGGGGSRRKKSSPNKSNGCLITLLKIFAILLLFPLLLSFGWIAGIVWFIVFRKKMNTEPDRLKKYTIGILMASIVSLILFVFLVATAQPTPETLSLACTYENQEIDVNTDYTIIVGYSPDNANLSNVTYKINNPLLATVMPSPDNPSDLILHTLREGSISITGKSGSTESNSLVFEIVDFEQIAKEQAEKNVIPNQADKAEVTQSKEAIAEELKDIDANAVQSPVEAKTGSTDSDMIPKANNTPIEELPTPKVSSMEPSNQQAESAESSNSNLVWIDDSAKKYHKKNGCGMDNAFQITLDEAVAIGKEPCGNCYR